ncbi:MAG: hypothetical protein Q7Q71_08395 [Verrucomicrobiota bacterium JB023]|nr:hypothetical protein [Verrucomicrobiota bacterium JB023]
MKIDEAAVTKEREEAWVGDAVLALYAREWLLQSEGHLSGEAFVRFTSNDFLRHFGNPTSVEAGIGRLYREKGLEAAFAWMEATLLPKFVEREKVLAARDQRGRKKR